MSDNLVSFIVDLSIPREPTPEQRAQLERLAAMDDESIDVSDIPPSDMANAVRWRDRHLYRPVKEATTVRIDADVLQWLRAKGRGYQTRINAILREAMMREAG